MRKIPHIIATVILGLLTWPSLAQYQSVGVLDCPVTDIKYNFDEAALDRLFADPPPVYRIVQYQMNKMFDSFMTDREFDEHVKVLRENGIGGAQLSVSWTNDYLNSPQEWDYLARNVERLRSAGFRIWIHDDKGFPSGTAGGIVVRDNPDLVLKSLTRTVQKGAGRTAIEMEFPESAGIVSAWIFPVKKGEPDIKSGRELTVAGKNKLSGVGIDGQWQVSVFVYDVHENRKQADGTINRFDHVGQYPNLLEPAAGKYFIDITHRRYAEHIPDIGRKVDVFYTGEAHTMVQYWAHGEAESPATAWSSGFPGEFRKRRGYDLVPYLDMLFEGDSDQAKFVRMDYHQTVADVFADNYPRAISKWCRENNVKAFFHPLLEEYISSHVAGYGDLMQTLRSVDIPACDIPIPKPDWGGKWAFWMPKFCSSAALLEGNKYVDALMDPIIGGNTRQRQDLMPDSDRLTRTVNMAFASGVTGISTYMRYNFAEPGRYRTFSDYLARLAVLLRGADNAASIAMYYPVKTFQANYPVSRLHVATEKTVFAPMQEALDTLARGIMLSGGDFNFLTDDAILKAEIKDGALDFGKNSYTTIIMPGVEAISAAVLDKLLECAKAGIEVFWAGRVPDLGYDAKQTAHVRRLARNLNPQSIYEVLDAATGKIKEELPLKVTHRKGDLVIFRYRRDGRDLYLIVNDSSTPVRFSVSLPGEAPQVKLYDPASGKIKESGIPAEIRLAAYKAIVVSCK